ncbi:MAG TPA: TraR/DksA family transcriptional regulator [Candidatus Polarisedimenticolaceae bacterium]|nr:TraR/DksA family transcriptional regulator [Candidatus Polarisedimenticolaceae bacterium]
MKAKPTTTTKKAAAKPSPAKAAVSKAPAKAAPAAAARKTAPAKPAKAAAAKVAPVPKPAVPPTPPPERRVDKARRAQWRKEMEKYRVALLAKQRELTDAYATVKGESREAPGGDGTEDYIDYAVNSYAKEFLLSLTELDRKQLILVEDALRRIDRGEYGRCMQCGDPINPKRLEVQPWARHCVRCQELEEQGLLPQYGSHSSGEPLDDDEEEGPEEEFEEVEAEEEEEVDLEVDTIPLEDEPGAGADDEE